MTRNTSVSAGWKETCFLSIFKSELKTFSKDFNYNVVLTCDF